MTPQQRMVIYNTRKLIQLDIARLRHGITFHEDRIAEQQAQIQEIKGSIAEKLKDLELLNYESRGE